MSLPRSFFVLVALACLVATPPGWSQNAPLVREGKEADDKRVVRRTTVTQTSRERAVRIGSSEHLEVVTYGLKSGSPGVPPYGTNPDGTPRWPLDDPGIASAQASTEPTPRATTVVNAPADSDTTAGNCLEAMNQSAAAVPCNPDNLQPAVAPALTPPGAVAPAAPLRQDAPLSTDQLRHFQINYALDAQRHAQDIFEGRFDRALLIATKWQALAVSYPDSIEAMTSNTAQKNNVPNFRTYIRGIIDKDLQGVSSQPMR